MLCVTFDPAFTLLQSVHKWKLALSRLARSAQVCLFSELVLSAECMSHCYFFISLTFFDLDSDVGFGALRRNSVNMLITMSPDRLI